MDPTAARVTCWMGHTMQKLLAPGLWDEQGTAALCSTHWPTDPAVPLGQAIVPPTTPDGTPQLVTVTLGATVATTTVSVVAAVGAVGGAVGGLLGQQ